ncbi:hypothetical protein K443DRAFT_14716 [Laccaria amethystina LaAM-08-1]|uniref:Uncharacterized protein n=1 Tax=Laccaria amethystina LaAM-08-1 TaxID=1095629 RepID=A0A0C9WME3_9AGAR|nr:hypothetical protein K443DRAFT_14716 [Laccaria amethystina LaAM-08-1]
MDSGAIPVDSGAIPVDSGGMPPFLQESVGQDESRVPAQVLIPVKCIESIWFMQFGQDLSSQLPLESGASKSFQAI